MQEGETVAYKWIDKNSLIEMSEDEIASQRAMKILQSSQIQFFKINEQIREEN